jgi:hypothetical protein
MADHDIAEWRKREHITWPRALVIGVGLCMMFFLPDAWAHWAVAIAFGLFMFIAFVNDAELDNVKVSLSVLLVGFVLLAFAYWGMPRDAWLSANNLIAADRQLASLALLAAGCVVAGPLLFLWALMRRAWRTLRPANKA